ncbi:MAG: hypothetical protein AAF617_15725 [Bacteroidota bacterium]
MATILTDSEIKENLLDMAPNNRLTKDSKAVVLLRQKLADGTIKGTEDPKQVWLSEPIFMEHKLNNFRTCYNNIRDKKVTRLLKVMFFIFFCIYLFLYFHINFLTVIFLEKYNLNRMNTEQVGPGPNKKMKMDLDFDEIEEKPVTDRDVSISKTFVPLYLISQWQEPVTTTKRVTVAIILPSGVGVGAFKVRVIEEGDVLELTVNWPKPLVDIEFMHRKWMSQDEGKLVTSVSPKLLGFEKTLRQMRNNRSETVSSVARIGLPITVQSHIESKYNIAWKDDHSRMVYVDLKAVVDDYATVNDTNDFDVV